MPAPTMHTSAVMSLVSARRDDISAVAIQMEVVAPEPLFMALPRVYYRLEAPKSFRARAHWSSADVMRDTIAGRNRDRATFVNCHARARAPTHTTFACSHI